MSDIRLRQLVCVLTILLAALAVPQRAAAQINPDLVSIDLTQQPSWTGEVWPADFNRDGVTDVTFLTISATGSALATARGRGDGTFDPPQVVAIGTDAPVGVGDVNGDGLTDIVTATRLVPGRGDGTFDTPVVNSSFSGPAQIVDMNGDGRADIVRLGATVISVSLGNGDFTFSPAVTIRVGFEPEGMIVTDLNGDGTPDIVNTSKGVESERLQLHFNAGNATFTTVNAPLPFTGGGVSARDMNSDGITDLIVGMGTYALRTSVGAFLWSTGQVAVFLGQGGGAFAQPMMFATLPGPVRVVVGDFNGDGLPDVATGNQTRGVSTAAIQSRGSRCEFYPMNWASVSVLLGRGDGTLGPAASFAMGDGDALAHPQSRIQRLNTSDLNADGRTDLLFTGGAGAIVIVKPPAENRPPVANAGPDRHFGTGAFGSNTFLGTATDPDHDWLMFEWRDQYGRVVGDMSLSCLNGSLRYPATHEFTFTVRDGRDGEDSDTMLATFDGLSPGPVPTAFTGESIGDVGTAPGTESFVSGRFSVYGGGADIWGTADAFRFVHSSVAGDFDVVARVDGVQNLHPWTKGGLMIREQLTPGSRHASVFATPTTVNGVAFQRREVENGGSVQTAGPAQTAPIWLRLVRQGDLISAHYRTLETEPWTLIGTQTLTALSGTVFVGMAVTSHLEGYAAIANFTNFAITPAPTGPPPPAVEWQTGDVGSVGAAGDVQFDGSTYTVRGSGADIWEYADAFRFVYLRVPGDGAITVRLADIAGPHEWSKAGLMIRQSLAADAAHHYLLASAANGLAYQRRLATGDASLHTGLAGAAAVWFHMVRSAGMVRLYYSTEPGPPSVWQPIAEAAFPAGEAFVGLAVTSHADGLLATGTFDHVSHTFTSSPGWTGADVGAVGIVGSDAFDGTTHTLAASGADIWDTADAFHFKFQPLPGNGSIVARVTSLNASDPWSKAGVMIRLSTGPSAQHAFMLLSQGNGVAFQNRSVTGGATTHTSGPAVGAPVWLRLTRNNITVTAAVSSDGSNWTTVGSSSVSGSALVGLAVTSHDNSALATATFDNVTVTPGP
jgi:regulation of enolase protein 1 (concanavalin A-like superfamily)